MKNQKKDLKRSPLHYKRSPLHYNGNKYSIAYNILEIIGNKKRIIEPFGGTGIVSLNSSAEFVWINDTNHKLVQLIKFIKKINKNKIASLIDKTNKYGLTSDLNERENERISNGTKGYSLLNKKGFIRMRDDYNKKNDIELLFLLVNYSFNRMIRFNSNNKFNVPVGKGDFSSRQVKYLTDYSKMLNTKETKITNVDYKSVMNRATQRDFVYIDPPYLNGNAQYNRFWDKNDEIELYKEIDKLDKSGIKFALSNTIYNNGILNTILNEWINKNNYRVISIKKKYSKTNYNKKNRYDAKEIIVTNEVMNGF